MRVWPQTLVSVEAFGNKNYFDFADSDGVRSFEIILEIRKNLERLLVVI